MSDRWADLRTLFDELVELDRVARESRLAEIGARDPSLRAKLEAMLAADSESATRLHGFAEAAARSILAVDGEKDRDPLGLLGTTIGRYRIDGFLGAGGMGVVYRATDERLGRVAAIKFLPPFWSLDEHAKQRFLHEARAASSLDHTNICTIYEAGETTDGKLYIAMACYEGETLQARLERGPVSVDEVLDLATQAARGLAAADARGLVHRDIKPANLLVTTDNTLKILDFGVAKAGGVGLTVAGQTPGTAAYMAPEQARGDAVDGRADLWSLGMVLYQMLTGTRPTLTQEGDEVPSLSAARPDAPAELAQIIERCLAWRPEDRFASAERLANALTQLRASASSAASRGLTRAQRFAVAGLAVIAVGAVAALVAWQVHDRRVNAARAEAIQQIERLADEYRIVDAFRLVTDVPRLGPEDPLLDELADRLSVPIRITSEPAGATVFYKDYREPSSEFVRLGETPLASARVPSPPGLLLWRVEEPGYEPLEATEMTLWGAIDFELTPVGESPAGMTRVPAGEAIFGIAQAVQLPGFWLGTFEVTNREYQAFVDAGGYSEPRYWAAAIEATGGEPSWEELMARFRDSTGRRGPATWALGSYADGTEDHPVRGVSWYEAAAFAEFAGGSLPTAYHWRLAAPWNAYGDLLMSANAESEGPVPIGSSGSVGRYGHHDMAGNVTEWVWNESPGGQRYILGGSWTEPSYTFTHNYARSPLDRQPDFGFRLAVYDSTPASELTRPVDIERHDFSEETAVSDEVFAVFRSLFAYDPLPLEPRIESVDDSPRHWRRETVSFTAAYGDERMIAHLFVPHDAEPPYQAAIYMPGAGARLVPSIDDMGSDPGLFVPRSGRVLVWPAYHGMLERGGGPTELYQPPREHRDRFIRIVNDLQRTVDYLQTRDDIESGSLAYLGLSIGGEYGPLFTAIEQRFAALVYIAGGTMTFTCSTSFPRSSPGTTRRA